MTSSASLCAFLDKPSGIAEFKFDRTKDNKNVVEFLQRFFVEIIAEAGAVADVIGVGTEFLAEAGDVDIYGAIRNDGS